jgi:GNAT superfamily N-acetyltransferase
MISAVPEPFISQVEELKPLLPDHWIELGIYKSQMPLDPEWGTYRAMEDMGQLLYVPLRNDGALIGYFIGTITPGLHYKTTLTCKMDICRVLPEFRGGNAGRVLFDAVKAELKRRGVKLWWVGSKDHHPIEGFYRSLGFEQQETHFTLWLGDDDA